jgi:hypothetical protein
MVIRGFVSSSRDSWGGRSICLLVLAVILGSFLSKVVDGVQREVLRNGAVEYVANGNVGGLVGVALFGGAVLCAAVGVVQSGFRLRVSSPFTACMFVLVCWWVFCAVVLRRDPVDVEQSLFIVGIGIVACGVCMDPPKVSTLRILDILRTVAIVLMFAVWFVDPSGSYLPCRPDKCGVFGSLYVGFVYTENAAAQLIILLLPCAIVLRRESSFWASIGSVLLFISATGSRTSLINLAVMLTFVVWHRYRLARSNTGIVRVRWTWRAIPTATLATSMFVFMSYSGSQLTGRGSIYAGVRQQLTADTLLIGSGPDTMRKIFSAGLLRHFQAIGEHGQAPHVLVQAGVIGFTLFSVALLLLLFGRFEWAVVQVAGFGLLLTASLQFVTEPGWTFYPRSLQMATMLLAMGLLAHRDGYPLSAQPNAPSGMESHRS